MVFPLILGALAAAGSAITTAVTAIGAAVSSFTATVGPMIAGAIQTLKPIADVVSQFANVFLQNLSILKPGETIEVLGERALQAAAQGIKLEHSNNFEDYLTKLRSVELDPKLDREHSGPEKLLAGLSIATVGVEDKFNAERGSLNGLWLLPMMNPQYFTPERMQNLVTTARLGNDVLAYLDKNLSGAQARGFEKSLETSPDGAPLDKAGLDALYDALDTARETWADVSGQVNANHQANKGE